MDVTKLTDEELEALCVAANGHPAWAVRAEIEARRTAPKPKRAKKA